MKKTKLIITFIKKIKLIITFIKNIWQISSKIIGNDNMISIEYHFDDFKKGEIFLDSTRLEMIKEFRKLKFQNKKPKQIKFIIILKDE